MFRFAKQAAVIGVVVAGILTMSACSPANKKLAAVGSDTTFEVLGALVSDYNADSGLNQGDQVFNVPPVVGGGSFTVAGDKDCGQIVYNSAIPRPTVRRKGSRR